MRRISLAEQLRKISLSFFGKKDLSDLTSTIMADCATLETASSHWIPELVGVCISTALFVSGAQMILKFGIATVALTGSILLAKGEIDVLTLNSTM